MKEIFEQMEAEVEQNVVDKKSDEIKRKNLLIENENLIADCLSKEVFYNATDSVLTVSRFTEMNDAYTVAQKRIVELEAEISKLRCKIQKDDHSEMIKCFSHLEVEHLNLQLKYQHLKESFGNNKSKTSSDVPSFDSALDSQKKVLTEKVNALQDLNERFREKNEKVKLHYKELYDFIKITRAKTIEKTSSLLTEIENLKAQIKGKMKCVTTDPVKTKVLAPSMYAIDVEPIPPRNRNNREIHLDYVKHLKESVETLHEIVEEARAEKPLDRSLASVCLYTKQSQELLEYGLALTNIHVIPSTGVTRSTEASRSKPRSKTKNTRNLPAKSDNKKKVKDHLRNNKSNLKQKNRVDSSISYKRTVINLNSASVCKTCNKYLIFANHDKCVVKYLRYVRALSVKNVVSTVRQVWKATCKLFTNVGYQWKPTRKKFTLGVQCPLIRFTKSKVVPVKKPKNVSTSETVTPERFSNTSQKPLTRYQRKNKQEKATSTGIPTITDT
ncbi:hypothetical protein Tco_1113009 [Tanacetum coccineum]|uniref:Integrase, catalytic region, zinc finger, CCHC-type, peptidase aspartic, catalytic n=1 Tax=Tanacetum coccineum TaxID=301880 RepID=A0ABQ5IRF8_9ASTR